MNILLGSFFFIGSANIYIFFNLLPSNPRSFIFCNLALEVIMRYLNESMEVLNKGPTNSLGEGNCVDLAAILQRYIALNSGVIMAKQ